MLVDFIFLLILFGLLYSYTSSQNQFAATASAIRQIWSGSCRLSCRHSEHSGLSGLSGLPPRDSARAAINNGIMARHGSIPGPSRDCSCESCPCALVDNFLKQCRPANTLYAQLIECISNLVNFILEWIMDRYESIIRAFECEVTCTEHPKITSALANSRDKVTFRKDDKVLENIKSSISKNSDNLELKRKTTSRENKVEKLSDNIQTTKSEVGTSKDKVIKAEDAAQMQAQSSKAESSKGVQDTPTTARTTSNSAELLDRGYCSKCIEKGRTCIHECPRAKDNKK